MRTTTMIGFGIGLALVLTQAPTPALGDDQDKAADAFLGTYSYQSGQLGDESIPGDHLKGKVRIGKDAIALVGEDGENENVIHYTLTPGEGEEPARIAMDIIASIKEGMVGSRATGLIAKRGDIVRLIYDLQEGRSPDDFKPDDAKQHYFVLKAEKQ